MIISSNILSSIPLAEGGEAVIYKSQNSDRVIKVYKDCVDIKDKFKRLNNLMTKILPSNVIVPLDLVYDSNKRFIGYEMKAIIGEDLKRLGNKKFIKANNITTKDILGMLVKLRDLVKELHKHNIIISDFNDGNVLFDKDFNLYFIDVDSWTIDDDKCQVCMESFQDPELKNNDFSISTDNYAFSILAFKSLTRLHPFGGTTHPDMDLLSRMRNKMSVIDRPEVKIPRTFSGWGFMSPAFINDLKDIYESGKRDLIGKSLDDFESNLKLCATHGYYYGKYSECPICNDNATIKTQPNKAVAGAIAFSILFNESDVKINLSKYIYINERNLIVHRKGKKINFVPGVKVHFSDNGEIAFIDNKESLVIINKSQKYKLNKIPSSEVIVLDNKVYFVDDSYDFVQVTVEDNGNDYDVICKASFLSIFNVSNKGHFLHNVINDTEIIDIDGYNYVNTSPKVISEYGIHHDDATGRWLFITEDNNGRFNTRVFDKKEILYEEDSIRYNCPLNNICFFNGTIFIPIDGAIRGYNYKRNAYKDFNCSIVSEESNIKREDKKFIVVNEKEVYQVG